MNISNQRIRIAVDTSQMGSLTDVITGNTPQFWNGVDLQIELAFFYGANLLSVSNIDSVTVDLKQAEPRTGLPLMTQTLASGSLNQGLTLAAWQGGAATDCHAILVFTNSQTNLDLNGDSETFWLSISGLTSDTPAHKLEFGAGSLTVVEGGEGVEPPAYVTTPIYYTGAQADARYTMAVNLTSINSSISTLNTEVASLTAVLGTTTGIANAALPKAGGTMTGGVVFTGTGYAALTLNSLTTTQRNALTAATGNLLFNSTTGAVEYYNGSAWAAVGGGSFVSLSGASMTGPLAFTGTTNPGLKVNSLTATQIAALTPAAGMVVFNSTANALQAYNGTAWVNVGVAPNVFTVASQTAMLALAANQGDLAVRTDLNQCFVLSNAVPSTLSNWVQLLTPASAVSSVNSLTGAITLTTANLGESGNLYFTTARAQTAAIAALLTGFTNATGGSVSASDSVVVALGRLENRCAINDAKVSAAGYAPLAGSTFTGPVQFSGSGNAGVVLSSLTDTQRAALTPAAGMIIYNATLNQIEYYNGAAWLILSTGSGTTWFSGSGAPSSSVGSSGSYYLNTANGAIYLNTAGTWASIWSPASLAGSYVPLTGATLTGPLVFVGTGFAAVTLNSVTTTQRNALTAAAGNVVFNSTTGKLAYYNGAAWVELGAAVAAPQVVASVSLANQTAAVGNTTLYTTPNDGTVHTYRFSATLWQSPSSTATGTVVIYPKYTSPSGMTLFNGLALMNTSTTPSDGSGLLNFVASPNTAIQYNTTVNMSPVFGLTLVLELIA